MKVLNENLMEQILRPENLNAAWKQVQSNHGSAGIDGLSIADSKTHLKEHWGAIESKLTEGRYKPSPVRRVYIPKDKGTTRPLGIPTVQDRVIQQAVKQILEPHFDGNFSAHSYGFRPGRGAHDAIQAAQGYYIQQGKDWVVDIDLQSFFDEVNHDRLMCCIGEVIREKEVLQLLGRYLRAGVYEDGKVRPSGKGVPQGGPLSPLLAIIYLDALDKELESRGLSFCRYADDCNIYVGSEKAAQRVFHSMVKWIEKTLKLPVNHDKSGYDRPWNRQFLGYQPTETGHLRPAPKQLKKFKDHVREYFSSKTSLSSNELCRIWKRYITGWCNYYKLANARYWRENLSSWIRRHIRKCFWQRWHTGASRYRRLKRLGVRPWKLAKVNLWGKAWRSSRLPSMHTALNNKTLSKYGLLTPSDFAPA